VSEVDDFIDGDPFDPELATQAETVAYEATTSVSDEVASFIRRRKRAYHAVFEAGNASKDDLQFVLLDLAHFCRAYRPTFHPTNQKVQDLQEGRREVYQRIMDFTRLSHDTLMLLYTDAEALRGMKR
jgi:hypothetical protein